MLSKLSKTLKAIRKGGIVTKRVSNARMLEVSDGDGNNDRLSSVSMVFWGML